MLWLHEFAELFDSIHVVIKCLLNFRVFDLDSNLSSVTKRSPVHLRETLANAKIYILSSSYLADGGRAEWGVIKGLEHFAHGLVHRLFNDLVYILLILIRHAILKAKII